MFIFKRQKKTQLKPAMKTQKVNNNLKINTANKSKSTADRQQRTADYQNNQTIISNVPKQSV